MVDAGAFPPQLLVRNARPLGQQVAGALDGMAQANNPHRTCTTGGETHHVHWVGIIEHEGVRAESLRVAQDLQPGGNRPQPFEQPARPNRVTDTLIDPVLRRDVVVVAHTTQATDLDAVYEIIRAAQYLATPR